MDFAVSWILSWGEGYGEGERLTCSSWICFMRMGGDVPGIDSKPCLARGAGKRVRG